MYTRVLATVNEFSNAEIAARYAVAFAQACHASLSLLYVNQANSPVETFNRAEAALRRLFLFAESRGVAVEIVTESGDPLKKIGEVVDREKIDIVFTSSRREDVSRRYFAKTLSRQLLLKLPCAVAMVRIVHIGRMPPKRILVPLRGRITHADERVFFVSRLAEGFGSSVTLFHSAGSVSRFFHGERHLTPIQRERRIPADIELFVRQLGHYGIRHEKRTGHGRVAHSIAVEAVIRRNDLIIMGASERGLLKSMLFGNPVEDVLRQTPCNLIVYRAGGKQRDRDE